MRRRRQQHAESGATIVEYALLLAFVALGAAAALAVIGVPLANVFCPVITRLGGMCS